jgi:hypothetical protein
VCYCVLLLHRMASEESAQSLLLALPDPCLMAVLQYCAASDQRSLLSAARAHSRLHQAAVLVLRSINAEITQQHQPASVLLYLDKHGPNVDCIAIKVVPRHRDTSPLILRQLPPAMQLSSLQLTGVDLQLQPGGGLQGVLGSAGVTALKQLWLDECRVHGAETTQALAEALSLLPAGLEHLSIKGFLRSFDGSTLSFPTWVLPQLQQLTCLELDNIRLQGPDTNSPSLQPLQALTQLADVRVIKLPRTAFGGEITASMLSGAHNLTRLYINTTPVGKWEAGVLAGKTQLQHLHVAFCRALGGPADEAQVLSHLWHLQQLTHLTLKFSLRRVWDSLRRVWDSLPAAAYAALTASSKLQHLSITGSRLPAGAWQHIFAAGKQLPHLQSLNIGRVAQPSGSPVPAPEGNLLVSCCPGLQSLDMQALHHSTGLLAAVQGLSGLHSLCAGYDVCNTSEGCNAVCVLTGLQKLHIVCSTAGVMPRLPLQLTQVKNLTALIFSGSGLSAGQEVKLTCEVS